MEVFSLRPGATELPLSADGIEADLIQIKNIVGLGPVKATVNTTPFGSVDGESHHGSSVGKRNIVITVGFNANWIDHTIESLRTFLYEYFMPKSHVSLRFFSTLRPTCEIEGVVESCEPVLFSKQPEMQISIICPQPDFISIVETTLEGNTVDDDSVVEIEYEGTAETGFELEVGVGDPSWTYSGNVLVKNITEDVQTLSTETTLDAANKMMMGSVRGNKYIQSMNGVGFITDLLRVTLIEDKWPELRPGLNQFSVVTLTPNHDWLLKYRNRYGGL